MSFVLPKNKKQAQDGETALGVCARKGATKCAQLLLAQNADPCLCSTFGSQQTELFCNHLRQNQTQFSLHCAEAHHCTKVQDFTTTRSHLQSFSHHQMPHNVSNVRTTTACFPSTMPSLQSEIWLLNVCSLFLCPTTKNKKKRTHKGWVSKKNDPRRRRRGRGRNSSGGDDGGSCWSKPERLWWYDTNSHCNFQCHKHGNRSCVPTPSRKGAPFGFFAHFLLLGFFCVVFVVFATGWRFTTEQRAGMHELKITQDGQLFIFPRTTTHLLDSKLLNVWSGGQSKTSQNFSKTFRLTKNATSTVELIWEGALCSEVNLIFVFVKIDLFCGRETWLDTWFFFFVFLAKQRRGAHNRVPIQDRENVLRGERTLAGFAKRLMCKSEEHRVVVLTGAGISTNSGIPDYRSQGSGILTNVMTLLPPKKRKTKQKLFSFWLTCEHLFLSLIFFNRRKLGMLLMGYWMRIRQRFGIWWENCFCRRAKTETSNSCSSFLEIIEWSRVAPSQLHTGTWDLSK